MRPWAFQVKVGDLLNDEDLSPGAISRGIAERMRELPYYNGPGRARDDEFVYLVDELAEATTEESGNNALQDLYDWADVNKRLWIDGF